MFPPSEWCVNSFILHEGFIVGYLFALLGVALFILQSIYKKEKSPQNPAALRTYMVDDTGLEL
jgi:hypothetical protein